MLLCPSAVSVRYDSDMHWFSVFHAFHLWKIIPGFAANETLLYSPELKFYSNKVKMDENLDTNIKGLHCLGDSSGWTRGLMMASVMGVLMGRKLAEKEGC